MNKKLNVVVTCGEKTCASKPSKFCKFLYTSSRGSLLPPRCGLFFNSDGSTVILKEIDHWTQRCDQCLKSEVVNNA